MLGPLKFCPILKEKVWGGDRLGTLLGKQVLPGARIGESWELSDRPEDMSVVAEGPLAGETLRDVLRFYPADVYGKGPGALPNGRFPLLVKFIDTSEELSVQVHPDDPYAMSRGLDDFGKTECWYVLEPPAEGVVLGVKPGLTPEDFRELVTSGRLEQCLHYEKLEKGDLVYCPAGTLHALTPPMLFAEIQQNSDITYRVHDWGRVGLDGRPRDLHVQEALEVTQVDHRADLRPRPILVARAPFVWEQLLDCPKFTVSRWSITTPASTGAHPSNYEVLIVIEGSGEIATEGERLKVRLGDTVLVPACVRHYVLAPDARLALLHVVGKP